jgi:hypothetical protein
MEAAAVVHLGSEVKSHVEFDPPTFPKSAKLTRNTFCPAGHASVWVVPSCKSTQGVADARASARKRKTMIMTAHNKQKKSFPS